MCFSRANYGMLATWSRTVAFRIKKCTSRREVSATVLNSLRVPARCRFPAAHGLAVCEERVR
jgi:hypothetical protein